MNALVILDDHPAGSGRASHGLALALELARADELTVQVFLLGDAVDLAVASGASGGGDDARRTIGRLVSAGIDIAASETDLAARGIEPDDLEMGVQPAPSSTLVAWAIGADRLLVF